MTSDEELLASTLNGAALGLLDLADSLQRLCPHGEPGDFLSNLRANWIFGRAIGALGGHADGIVKIKQGGGFATVPVPKVTSIMRELRDLSEVLGKLESAPFKDKAEALKICAEKVKALSAGVAGSDAG